MNTNKLIGPTKKKSLITYREVRDECLKIKTIIYLINQPLKCVASMHAFCDK